jgi:hypothetical protein
MVSICSGVLITNSYLNATPVRCRKLLKRRIWHAIGACSILRESITGKRKCLKVGTATAARVSQTLQKKNVVVEQRDFVIEGCGREAQSASVALLFNILHIEEPLGLLREAHRVIRPGGSVAIIHWNYDLGTPRGPPLSIRPRPEACRAWGAEAGLRWLHHGPVPGAPWHWGMALEKPVPILRRG